MAKPILCLDFNGVVHSHQSGWNGTGAVPDLPVPGALKFILGAVESFDVHIYSARSNQPVSIVAMQEWLTEHLSSDYGIDSKGFVLDTISWPATKPPALVTLDDRAITFTGAWPTVASLLDFRPWHKQR